MKKVFATLLAMSLCVALGACSLLTACGGSSTKKPGSSTGVNASVDAEDSSSVLLKISGGHFRDGSNTTSVKKGSTSKSFEPDTKLAADGSADTFTGWTWNDGNPQSNNSNKLTVVIPENYDKKELTIYGNWAWYGKAAENVWPTGDQLTVYLEDNGGTGTYDNVVRAYIEKSFKDQMGYSISLDVNPYTTEQLGTKVAGDLASGTVIDILVNHWGSDSPIDGYLKSNMTKSVETILREADVFRDVYYASDAEKTAYYTGYFDNTIKGISSIDVNARWGMLMNATMLDSLYNLVQTDETAKAVYDAAFPENLFPDRATSLSKYFDCANDFSVNMTISQFTSALYLTKRVVKTIERPLNAAGWCVDYLISPTLGGTTYGGFEMDASGRIIPSYATEGYLRVMLYEQFLQKNNLWYENPNSADGNDFYSMKNLVMISWPEGKSLIEQSRKMGKLGQECIVLKPLALDGTTGIIDPNDTSTIKTEVRSINGNARQSTAFSGFVVFANSTKDSLIAKYLNWLYTKDANGNYSNYELATYGVENEHWVKINNGGTITWDYPADKKDAFEAKEPYSGRYGFISNAYVANYVKDSYTEQESTWYDQLLTFKTYSGVERNVWIDGEDYGTYGSTYAAIFEGINMPSIGNNVGLMQISADIGSEYTSMRAYAWSPTAGDISAAWNRIVSKFDSDYKPLIDWYTEQFEYLMKVRRNDRRVGE